MSALVAEVFTTNLFSLATGQAKDLCLKLQNAYDAFETANKLEFVQILIY